MLGPDPERKQAMTFKIDESMHWTDHYVEYGFATLKGLVDRSFVEEAIEEVRRFIGEDRPVSEWTQERPKRWHHPFYQDPGRTGWTEQNHTLEKLYDQPRLRAAIDEMFGDPSAWDGVRNYYIFLNPFDPAGKAALDPLGHIDFKPMVPILYRGFTFQIALLGTEPFGGNTTIYPGTHKLVQQALVQDPMAQMNKDPWHTKLPRPMETYEFVAEPGDVMFMHHLVYHSGNDCHAASRRPRLGLHAEAFRTKWLTKVDPADPNLSPWERSLAYGGYYEASPQEADVQKSYRQASIPKLEHERGITIDEKWKRYSDWPDPSAWREAACATAST